MDSQQIKAYFEQKFHATPTLVVRAPGRINLIGEHTDYNCGYVLPAAIDKAIWFAASKRDDQQFVFHAFDLQQTFTSQLGKTQFHRRKSWVNYLLGVISELRKDGHQIGGLDLVFGGDVPLGAGLSSSAALESGMAFVLNQLNQLGLEHMDLVHIAQRGENQFVGMQCGIMDMFTSVMGRANQVVRLDCRSLKYDYFSFESAEVALLLLDSGVKHQLIDSEYNTRRAECESGVQILAQYYPYILSLRDATLKNLDEHRTELPQKVYQRCRFVVEEIARVEQACAALLASDFALFGALMFDGHDGLNQMYEVCVPETNFLVEQARGQILGARQMGGGFGGCTINLLKISDLDAYVERVSAAYLQKFGIELRAYPVKLMDGVAVVK
jgi:galactokinase